MNDKVPDDLKNYFRAADEWSADRERSWRMALRTAWIAAGVLGVIALAEAGAIIMMMPLKTVVPYTLMVDRQTGYVQAIKPLDRETVAPDKALVRSFIAQYVIAREGFDIDSLKEDYRKVTLWSTGEARNRYVAGIQASNPTSPLTAMPRRAIITTEIRGISSLGPDTVLVRFVTMRTDPGGQAQAPQPWQAVVTYRFAAGTMSAADRLANPLGFQVLRYRRDAEISPSGEAQAAAAQPAIVRPSTTGVAGATIGAPSGAAMPLPTAVTTGKAS